MADWMFFDNHTFTAPDVEISNHMARDYQHHWLFHEEKRNMIEKRILELLGAYPSDHFFLTSGRSESNFTVLFSHYMDFIRETGRTHILTCEHEHPSIIQGLQRLEKLEVQGKLLPLNNQGQLDPQTLIEAIRPRSGLLSLSWANDLTGVIQPIEKIANICTEHDLRLHVDASSVIGKIFFQCSELPIHFITFDGKLFHCPGAFGGLIVHKDHSIKLLYPEEEKRPVADYAALGVALENSLDRLDSMGLEMGRLRNFFESEVQMHIPDAKFFFQDVDRLPNCCCVSFPGVHGEALRFLLQRQGIFISTGEGRLAKTLLQCGIEPILAHGAISFAFSHHTTQAEIERTIPILAKTVEKLLKIGGKINVAF